MPMNDYSDYPLGDQDSHKKHVRHVKAMARGKVIREKNALKKSAMSQALISKIKTDEK